MNDVKIKEFDVIAKLKEQLIKAGVNMDNLKDIRLKRDHCRVPGDRLSLPVHVGTVVSIEFEYLGAYDPKRKYAPGEELEEIHKILQAFNGGMEFAKLGLDAYAAGNMRPAKDQPKLLHYKVTSPDVDDFPVSLSFEVDGEMMQVEPTIPLINENGDVTFEISGDEPGGKINKVMLPKKRSKKKSKKIDRGEQLWQEKH